MNAFFKIYFEDTIALVRSMIIKFDATADAMNRPLTELGAEIPVDKAKWRYYKHLAGEYHALDTQMTIKSLDDSSIIVFSKENLEIHKKTRTVYLNNVSYVDTLEQLYPMQSILVRGILHPIAPAVAIAANDGQILYHDSRFVEPQEQSVIPESEQWIQSYLYRYMMESYTLTDELFTPTVIGQIYTHLPVKILGIRYNAVKTAETHSFHIRRYLASHNRLEEFVDYMTLEQQLYLYRNILYIQRHTGMSLTFDDLIEHVMTLRNLPVYDYRLRQQRIVLDENQLSPTPMFVRTPINLDTTLASRTVDEWPVKDVIYKEIPQAVDNLMYVDNHVSITNELVENSSVSNLPTKIVHAAAIDPEDLAAVKLIDVLLSHWALLACNGTYTTEGSILNPITGDTWKLNSTELLLMYLYTYMYGYHGIRLTEFPSFKAMDVAKLRWIPKEEYLKVVAPHQYQYWDRPIEFFQETYYEIYNTVASADDLMTLCTDLLQKKRLRHQYVFQPHRSWQRAGLESLYNYSYQDVIVHPQVKNVVNYADWFRVLNFDFEMLSMDEYQEMALELLDAGTSYDAKNMIGLKEIQSAMVKLFKRLSSYTIQFIEEVISDDNVIVDPLIATPDTTMESLKAHRYISEPELTVISTSCFEHAPVDDQRSPTTVIEMTPIIDRSYNVDITVDVESVGKTHFTASLLTSRWGVLSVKDRVM